MTIRELYELLMKRFGERSDPETWWPIYFGRSDPPAFERAITNILVQNGSWKPVRQAVESLDRAGLLTARALSEAALEAIAECAKPTGLQAQKAMRLQGLGQFVMQRFGGEREFYAKVTRDELLSLPGIGDETADRIILYTCYRLAWPVDTYCRRVLACNGVIAVEPTTPAEKRRVAAEIKQMVERELPRAVIDWQRLHAVMQLEGEAMRKRKVKS